MFVVIWYLSLFFFVVSTASLKYFHFHTWPFRFFLNGIYRPCDFFLWLKVDCFVSISGTSPGKILSFIMVSSRFNFGFCI